MSTHSPPQEEHTGEFRTQRLARNGGGTREWETVSAWSARITSVKTLLYILGGIFVLGGTWALWAARLATKEDLKGVILEHTSRPHPLSEEEKAVLRADHERHERDIEDRATLKADVRNMNERVDWLVNTSYDEARRKGRPVAAPPKRKPQ